MNCRHTFVLSPKLHKAKALAEVCRVIDYRLGGENAAEPTESVGKCQDQKQTGLTVGTTPRGPRQSFQQTALECTGLCDLVELHKQTFLGLVLETPCKNCLRDYEKYISNFTDLNIF